MKNSNSSPQLPPQYKVIAEKAFRKIRKNLISENHSVYVTGRTHDNAVDSLTVKYDNTVEAEKNIVAEILKSNLANFDADFYMYAEQPVNEQRHILLVIETKEGRWVATCEAKSFSIGKVKNCRSVEWTRDDDIIVTPFDGLLYSPKPSPENQIVVIDSVFGDGTLQKIYESEQLKNWVSLLDYEMSQGIETASVKACALLIHKMYSELDAITGAGFIKKMGPYNPNAIRDPAELKKLEKHYKARGSAFESAYGIKCSVVQVILTDCFNDILLHAMGLINGRADENQKFILENSVLEVLQAVIDWADAEEQSVFH